MTIRFVRRITAGGVAASLLFAPISWVHAVDTPSESSEAATEPAPELEPVSEPAPEPEPEPEP